MWNIHKQKLQLLFSMDEMIVARENGMSLLDENWDDMRDGLSALNLPAENVLFQWIGELRGKGGANDAAFSHLKACFGRFFDAQTASAANSSKISENYRIGEYGCDREFAYYAGQVRNTSHTALAASVLDRLQKISEEQPDYYQLVTTHSQGWYFEKNWLDGVSGGNNSLISNRVATLKQNIDRFEWLYENLADAVSRRSLSALVKFWLTWDYRDWQNIALYSNDVVDTSVFPFYPGEVFVDCGSYIGDTVAQYVNTVNAAYTRVYTYDISRDSVEQIKKNLAPLPNVVVYHKGTGDINTTMEMFGTDAAFHGNTLATRVGKAVDRVEVVRLDDDIREPVTFLKIDCEGMDKETLRGARDLVRKYHPKLHVDSYHKLADIVDVPWLIREIDPSYTLYLRLPTNIGQPPRFPAPAYMAV